MKIGKTKGPNFIINMSWSTMLGGTSSRASALLSTVLAKRFISSSLVPALSSSSAASSLSSPSSSNALQTQSIQSPRQLLQTPISSSLVVDGVIGISTVTNPNLIFSRGYRSGVKINRLCSSCFYVMREGRLHVECHKTPQHKSRAIFRVQVR